MPKFLVHAQVMVPVFGHISIEAKDSEEAMEKAVAEVKGEEGSEPWNTLIWVDGGWTNDIRWEAATDFELTDIEEEDDEPVEVTNG